ncbi:MAG TPA: class I SAM-dependent methyltransferase [Gaiellaceae bacterium]|nr:class I SAM-dependent methyltransferase [Gaiellaceae bacterium]
MCADRAVVRIENNRRGKLVQVPDRGSTLARPTATSIAGGYLPLGAHLVGSVPLGSGEEVFRTLGERLGDRLRRLPDGETGPRADWIVWQYPVLSSRTQFEVAPPAPGSYRALPRLRLRSAEDAEELRFGSLGYADAAAASYAIFAPLKRDGLVPPGARFQVCLPTPLAPVSAFVAVEDQAVVERAYEAAMMTELEQLLAAVPHDQLALQWDTNVEFGMLAGELPVWFPDVKTGILERLIRISRAVPPEVELGFHFCLGHDEQAERHVPADMRQMVEVANGLAATLDRPLNWVHMPLARDRDDRAFVEPLRDLRVHSETELYLGALHGGETPERTRERIATAHDAVTEFGLATPCGWGRLPPGLVPELLDAHAELSRPVADPDRRTGFAFDWGGFERIPDEDWIAQPVDSFGLHYDTVENHGWYRNLDLTVEQLAGDLREGQVLIDYSGGTGILLDRLRLRIFDRQVGMLIVDSSPKFLRVALDRFRADERVAFRRLRYLKDERRLQYVDEVLPEGFVADALVSTNAIHLYDDLENTLRAWARVLRPGGRVRINSGNLRNPRAGENEWIIDETVYVVHEVATGIVRTEDRYSAYRPVLDDEERMRAYLDYRDRVFLAPRPLEHYTAALESAGFAVEEITERTIEADVEEWYAFLAAYADAVLGWVGGSAKVDGGPASEEAAADRLRLLHDSLAVIFGGRETFLCCWTYITATRA